MDSEVGSRVTTKKVTKDFHESVITFKHLWIESLYHY